MATVTKPIPEGYHSATPYLIVRGAAEAIDFYKRAFGAKERMRLMKPDGTTVAHAELAIGDSKFMLGEEDLAMGARSAQTIGGTPVSVLPTALPQTGFFDDLAAGNANDIYDIGGLQGGSEKELAKRGLIAPWDLSQIPNYSSLWEWAKNIPYLTFEGKIYGIPTVVNADSMIALRNRVGNVDSYGVIFDRTLRGKTAMEDAWINSVIFTAMYLKNSENAKIAEPGDLTADELGLVMEFLIKHKKDRQFRTFWNGWEQGLQLIANQEVWVMTGWEPIVYAARRRGLDCYYAVPKEGYEAWIYNTILLKGAVDRARETARVLAGRIRGGDVLHDPKGGECPQWCDLWPMCRIRRA
jgi:uncharacterized glyoxalase superfamily protein PhnB